MRKMKLWLAALVLYMAQAGAQPTFPVNGVASPGSGAYAFTNATIVKDAKTTIANATLVIRDGKIVAVGAGVAVPKDAVVIDCKDKFIYPSFIDVYSDYGMPARAARGSFDFRSPAQLETNVKGAYGWNQALKADVDAVTLFVPDDAKAKAMREAGFGAVLTHQQDGIARGTGTVVTLASERANLVLVKPKASAHYSFNKGTSTQSYPGSLMGGIALMRQTYLDAQWYKTNPKAEGVNLTLAAFNDAQSLPQVFDPSQGGDLWNLMRADRVGDEFGVQYIIKGSGKEYQRIPEVAATKAPLIVSLNYPTAQDVEDPNDARYVSLADMKHWELAPGNPAALEKAGVTFALTSSDVRDGKTFMANLRKAMEYGLSETAAMDALTKTPATLLGVYDKVGSLDAGKLANFVITNGPVFSEKTTIHHNWVQGIPYRIKDDNWYNTNGNYALTVNGPGGVQKFNLEVKSSSSAEVSGKDTLNTQFSFDGKMVKIGFAPKAARRSGSGGGGGAGTSGGGRGVGGGSTPLPASAVRLSGISNGDSWQGTGLDSLGNTLTWSATRTSTTTPKSDSAAKKAAPFVGAVTYPFVGFGAAQLPKQETILFKNATVWTSDKDGVLKETDVLVKNGKIAAVGKNLSESGARVIDATGKHLSAGIIDEHSHIAVASINEGGQSVTSEVRIKDNLDPDDINIYRQLSGGVTTSHILHGSANTIGGQTQLIKLRWGASDTGLIFKGADGFIKFALGENVKRTSATNGNTRYPDTRMGVEQVLIDAFTRAKDYEAAMKASKATTRRDLELDALVEIMNKQRYITCHSYVASEITSTMRVAEKFGFRINTFTHILEGYKVADKMKAHGANASTFSDWWAYKMEVQDAIPYNAAIMTKVGLNVAINSDDAEMARRLNQEAAKSVKYGGLTEVEAMNMVTINPAKMLHVDDKVGSIKVGKDADLVLWSDNPLSIYAKSLYTVVDGAVFFDREKDAAQRKVVQEERTRLIKKMMGEKGAGRPTIPAQPSYKMVHTCGDHAHKMGMLELEDYEEENIH
ncbi:MAG TPA: amidohydrolase family protein [Phnomibacter sp.]|nr:amidohydrolase family protein [Phnomibacter sp.]